MEGLFFLIIAAFLFAVFGVIALLVRTYRQTGLLRQYDRRLTRLEEDLRRLSPGASAGTVPVSPAEDVPAGPLPSAASPAGEAAETPPLSAADTPAPLEPSPAAETFPAQTLPETAEPAAASVPAAGPPGARKNSLAAFIRGGNLWAAGGIILLIAAFAMLITYLANRGFFTVEMGIAAAALSGLVMLALGWRFRKKRPVYFLLLQGGGIGILYLSVIAAHKLTPYFPAPVSLVLLSLLIPPAIVLALFQRSQALALLGFLGGYAAPLLLAPGGGNQVFLFSYYGVLDLGVLAISLFRRWRGLNLLAFAGTFGAANYWAAVYYEPALFREAEPFFLAYILIFTILGLRRSGGKNRAQASMDLTLVLGTPLAGAALQWKVFGSIPHGHALISLGFSAFYIVLALVIRKRRDPEQWAFSEGCLGLGLLLANLAIPLELAPRITSAVWAAEGAAVFFFGLRLKNRKAAVAGLVLHLAAAIAFAAETAPFASGEGAFRGARFIGALVIALSALVMVFFAGPSAPFPERRSPQNRGPALPLAVWAFIWWFGGWAAETHRALTSPGAVLFGLCSVFALASFGAARFLRAPAYRIGMIPAPALGLYLTLEALLPRVPRYAGRPWLILSRNFLEGPFRWSWPAFFVVQALLLFAARKKTRPEVHGLWFLLVAFITLGVLSSSGRALTLSRGLAPAWTSLAGMAPLFLAMAGICLAARRIWPPEFIMRGEVSPPVPDPHSVWSSTPPLSGGLPPPQRPPASPPAAAAFRKKIFLFVLPLALSCVMGLWFTVTLFLAGDPAPLPLYIPLINPLDLEEAFCIVLFLLWQSVLSGQALPGGIAKPRLLAIIDTAVFLFTMAVTARSVHFYGGVPYALIFRSDLFHLCLFILWAVYGIGHIIAGSRRSLRKVWIAGAVLTVADIGKLLLLDMAGTGAVTRIVSFFIAGLLLLFIGWAAPLPPAAGKEPPEPEGQGQFHAE